MHSLIVDFAAYGLSCLVSDFRLPSTCNLSVAFPIMLSKLEIFENDDLSYACGQLKTSEAKRAHAVYGRLAYSNRFRVFVWTG